MHRLGMVLALLTLYSSCALAQQTGTLTVEVDGLDEDKGQVIAVLFDGPSAFPFNHKAAHRLFNADISSRTARVVFRDIPYGKYAVLIAHDKDFSNTMKFRARFPAEGYGTSNNYDAGLAGLSFEASAFRFASPEETIRVNARYGSAADKVSIPEDRLRRPRGLVNVSVEGLRSATGNVLASLYAVEDGFPFDPERAALRTYGTIESGKAQFPIEYLPYGEYSLILFHDENMNGKMDLLPNGGIKEGYGVSGNYVFKYGPPIFRRTLFSLEDPVMGLNINITYETLCSRIRFPADRESGQKGDVTVQVSNIRKAGGWVMGALFPSKKGFPAGLEHASMLTYARSEGGKAALKFPAVPYGEYAIAVFHDSNQDGRFNRFLGIIPSEQYGASNDAVRTFGPPKYKKARFSLGQPQLLMGVRLK